MGFFVQDSVIHALGCFPTFGKRNISKHPACMCMNHAILHGKPFVIPLTWNDTSNKLYYCNFSRNIVALHPFMQFVLQQNSVLEVAENVSNINAANLKTMAGVSGATFNLICHNSFTYKQDWLLTLV